MPPCLLQVTIYGVGLEFLLVVFAFHCDVLVCHCICYKWWVLELVSNMLLHFVMVFSCAIAFVASGDFWR
jgi:hypothetical protein